ncbi:hypothetical protein [Acinetobacter sp. CFCC 10889]|uniref:hypothetical protein n=1 Tax=Acinetobacter sp. CFCC 10889 TaxID=1775557 RepID=UPI000DD013E1|nr:hypothetical protein [Acinetobacter sp. CFCC 10889]
MFKVKINAKNRKGKILETEILNQESYNIFKDLNTLCDEEALHAIKHQAGPFIAYQISSNVTIAYRANKDSTTLYLNDSQAFVQVSKLGVFNAENIKRYSGTDTIHSAIDDKRINGLKQIARIIKISNVTYEQYKKLMAHFV